MANALKRFSIVYCIALILMSSPAYTFQDFAQLTSYVQTLEEAPAGDAADWQNPHFYRVYQANTPSLFSSFLHYIGMQTWYWSIDSFTSSLNTINQQRKQQKDERCQELYLDADDSIYVWGDLHASIHTLYRSLLFLHERDIINEDFVINDPHVYFIILGDAIDRSAYSLQTLTLLFRLLEQNPDRVMYIRGNHETDQYWENFDSKVQLAIYLNESFPLLQHYTDALHAFFNTLLDTVYVHRFDECIRISHGGRTRKEFNREGLSVRAIVHGEDRSEIPFGPNGLNLITQDFSATAWSVLSCPVYIYQEFFGFYYDAFVKLSIGDTVDRSTIQLISRDVRTDEPLAVQPMHNIVSGKQVKKEVKAKPGYLFGSTMSLTRGVSALGKAVEKGLSLVINQINADTGVHGRILRPLIFDDHYVPFVARQNVRDLQAYDIRTLLLPVGSPTLVSYLPQVKSQDIGVFFPVTGGTQFRKPDIKGIVHYRASYANEARALIDILIDDFGIERFAIFYQNDAYGISPLQEARRIFRDRNIKNWLEVSYNRTQNNYTEGAKKLAESQAQAVLCFSSGNQTRAFLQALGLVNSIGKKFAGISFLADRSFREFVDNVGLPFIFSQVVPNPRTSDLNIVQEYRRYMDMMHYPYDVYSLEGYIASQIFVKILSRTKGPLTMKNMIDAAEQIKDTPFKGLYLDFDKNQRSYAQHVWIEGWRKHWVRKNIER
jgi:ABC-type branched-subunit amino acid transport system substrate-binding protein